MPQPTSLTQLGWLFVAALVSLGSVAQAIESDATKLEFFEIRIRPLLSDHCYQCHSGSAKKLGAGLRLDSKAAIIKGGDSGAAVSPGKPDESLLVQAIRYESNEMPPKGKLSDADIAALEKWVEWGAPWPVEPEASKRKPEQGYDWETASKHWAWQPLRKPAAPAPQDGDRIENPIDQFVTAKLRGNGMKQGGEAATAILVRRCFIDLVGVPPSTEELDHWVSRIETQPDANRTAFGQLIDELLERPQYGERWGRHWLDVARYSDTGGWTQDNRSHPSAWRYRDWVVSAFNADMPYNEFVRRQIVGDRLNPEAAVGTGFFALGPHYSSDGGDPESIAQAKSETLDDRVDTFSRAFLGLTVSCARCHDHKFDPIPTQDYYSIAGVFNNTREGETPLVDALVVREYHEHQGKINRVQEQVKQIQKMASQEKREPHAEEKTQIKTLQDEIKELQAVAPPKYPFAHTIHDAGSADMQVALRGNLLKPGRVAPRRFLRIVAGQEREHFTDGSGRRQLADAVVATDNPLTARVFVNRIWLNHFGQALVSTPSNFGTLGALPTHPELLDWLATQFIESGWSTKSLHRLIMTSATYRNSSEFNEAAYTIDSDNRYLWRMNPRRMDVETWRDSLLAVTGELDSDIGGPSIDRIVDSKRRTLYAKVSRNEPQGSDDFLRLFDFPIPRASAAKRTSNVIPQQFLFMLNSQFMLNRANAFAKLLQQFSDTDQQRIQRAYSLLYGREPAERELQVAIQYLGSNATTGKRPDRWQQYCQVLLSANEFMYIR